MMADGGELRAPPLLKTEPEDISSVSTPCQLPSTTQFPPLSLKREREDDTPAVSTPQNPATYQLPAATQSLASLNLRPSPAKSTTSSSGLSDAPSTIASLSPAHFNSTAPPPAKKQKLTFQEKELEKQRKAQEKQEKELAKIRREAEKEENKRKAEAEREAKKARLEAEKEERRIAQEKQAAAKLKKKQQQEAEKAAKEEEKRKKEGSQKTLTAFFGKPKTNHDTQQSSEAAGSGSSAAPAKKREQLSEYEKLFPSFFVHENVTMAPTTKWERDDAGREYITNAIDKALQSWDGDSSRVTTKSEAERRRAFDAAELFSLPPNDFRQRGRIPRPVAEIMADMNKVAGLPLDSQRTQIKNARSVLSTIPFKFLQFTEDVRPPYRGTFTRPMAAETATKLARNPLSREMPDVDYDYDSEAEWVDEPGDDLGGEDLDSEGETDDGDGGLDDLDDFVDNSGQDEFDRQQAVGLEPISTGLCWEDKYARNWKDGKSYVDVCRYKMEVVREPDEQYSLLPLDPFSTAYYPQDTRHHNSLNNGLMNPPRLPLTTSKSTNVNINGQPFLNPAGESGAKKTKSTASTTTAGREKKLIAESEMQKFKDIIQSDEFNTYTKGGLVDALYHKFDRKQTKKALQNTLEAKTDKISGKWTLTG